MTPRILFLTGLSKEHVLEALVRDGADVAGVVVPDSPKYRSRAATVVSWCESRSLPVVMAPPDKLDEAVQGLEFNLLLSCGYPFVVPMHVCERAAFAINIHPTLLPRHRGKYVIHVLLDGDEESGATAHLMTDRLDAGPIIGQRRFKVSPFDTVQSLLRKSGEVETDLVTSVVAQVRAGTLTATPQDERQATTHVTARTPEDSEIDPEKSLRELFYQIRAFDPVEYPAFFRVKGEKVYIRLWRKNKPQNESDLI